ncbi:MAG: hypothetical protein MK179_18195 [Pirellulaceae bacterium]|nr:hypothetical protein [Pirellulaceae bacterium]
MTKLSDVNTTDIIDAVRLGCGAMCRVLNADDHGVPFFDVVARPDPKMSFCPYTSEAHVPGRFLNALLTAEHVLGIDLDEEAVEKITRAAFLAYEGTLPLPLNRNKIGGRPINFLPHHIREGFHALYALVRYRNSQQARELAESSIDTIFQYWQATSGWDYQRLESDHQIVIEKPQNFLNGLGRSIGSLVKYYQATDYGPALDLAIALKDKAIAEYFTEDGAYQEAHGAHCHSTTSVISSLAQLADLTDDVTLRQRVKAFYDNGLWEIRDALGWSIESLHPGENFGRGEANNSADILETALILGSWGHPEYYHDAERILRGHLLPSQLRDVSFIIDPPNPENDDGKTDVAGRIQGSFGFPAPYGHQPINLSNVKFNTDIVGGTVGALCEVFQHATRFDRSGHWVNLLFDHETSAIDVQSPYTQSALRITLKRPGPLFLRLPPWVDIASVKLEGATGPLQEANHYAFIPEPPVKRAITVEFPLTRQEITLKNPLGPLRVQLEGDGVIAMENFGADLTFFDSLESES